MRLLAATLALLLSLATAARADYPEKPIRLVVPFPPGGVTDIVARLLAERLSAEFGQQVLVDNKTGAGGVIAGDIVAKAAPDGYTLLLTTPNHTINAAFRANLPYDTEKDFRAVSNVGQVPMLLVTHPSLPVTSFQGFIDYARKNPGKINVSSAGNGTLPHITMELLIAQGEVPGDQRALSRRRAGAGRPGGGPGAGQARQLHPVGAVHRRQEAQPARRHQHAAAEAVPRRAGHDREASGLRRLSVDGHPGSGRHARRGGQKLATGHPALRRAARDPGALRQGRHRARRQRADASSAWRSSRSSRNGASSPRRRRSRSTESIVYKGGSKKGGRVSAGTSRRRPWCAPRHRGRRQDRRPGDVACRPPR